MHGLKVPCNDDYMNYRKSVVPVLLGLDEQEEEETREADRRARDGDEDFYESISMFYDYAPSRFVLCFLSSASSSCMAGTLGLVSLDKR